MADITKVPGWDEVRYSYPGWDQIRKIKDAVGDGFENLELQTMEIILQKVRKYVKRFFRALHCECKECQEVRAADEEPNRPSHQTGQTSQTNQTNQANQTGCPKHAKVAQSEKEIERLIRSCKQEIRSQSIARLAIQRIPRPTRGAQRRKSQ